ncbi:MAG: hypothetical protein JWO95_1129, partial [Verrucomicrobiales bacterium]|nr:hypothetical protein [Verrucomicrobiales bacterium]
YLLAMEEVRADTKPILDFIHVVKQDGLGIALEQSFVPPPAVEFVHSTFQFIGENKPHCTAAAFAFGREDLIPGMFGALLEKMKITQNMAPNFHYYLRRHTQLDGEEHGPLALELVSSLCGDDQQRTAEAATAAKHSLQARITFWDGVAAAIRTHFPRNATGTEPHPPR